MRRYLTHASAMETMAALPRQLFHLEWPGYWNSMPAFSAPARAILTRLRHGGSLPHSPLSPSIWYSFYARHTGASYRAAVGLAFTPGYRAAY